MSLRRGTPSALALLILACAVLALSSGCDVRCDPANGAETCPDSAPHCVVQGDGVGICQTTPGTPPGGDGGLPSDSGPVGDAGPSDAGPVDPGPLDAGSLDGGSVDAGGTDAGPACMSGAPCDTLADCLGPCAGDESCFDATCTVDGCSYDAVPDRVCSEAGCNDGTLLPETLCGADGSCTPASETSCNGYACANGGDACRTNCADGLDCVDGYFCATGGTCEPLVADGDDCSSLGDVGCASGYCDGQRCCSGGSCCNAPADCPNEFSLVPTCSDTTEATECQGTRIDATCVENVCGNEIVTDDSGCDGTPHACPNGFAPVLCSAAVDQSAPVCLTTCVNTLDCLPGYDCVTGACEPLLGLGAQCGTGEPACEVGLKCESDRCCDDSGATCCDAATEAAACSSLACNLTTFSCETTCVTGTSQGCASASDYCVDGSSCAPKKVIGSGCGVDGECASGSCADGFCCDGPCDGACQACSSALTGGSDGTCGGIVDDVDNGLCDASGAGCSGASCRCDNGTCKLGLGLTCSVDGDCASGECECADSGCSTRKCNAVACPDCKFADASYADTTCSGNRSGNGCTGCGDASCECAAGVCLSADGQVCAVDGECASANCECANSGCTSKKCNAVACATCKYDASNYVDGTCSSGTTGNSCTGCGVTSCQCSGGSCLRVNNQTCTSDSQCVSGNCECADSTCTARKCSAVACAGCKYNSNGDSSCEGSIVKGDSGSCPSGQVCATTGGSCASPGSCSCSCFTVSCGPAVCGAGATNSCNSGFHPSSTCGYSTCTCTSCSATGSCSCVPD